MRWHIASVLYLAVLGSSVLAAPPKYNKNDDPPPVLTNDAWKGVSKSPLQAGEIDRMIAADQEKAKVKPSPVTTDEQFIRRVMLDLTGRLPVPADVTEFQADKDPNKRAKLIDRLLESDDYVKHWSRYWRDVFIVKVTDQRGRFLSVHFDAWLEEQFRKNQPWDEMAKELITSNGQLPLRFGQNPDPDAKNGSAWFLLAYQGNDAIYDWTAQSSRIFLGLQIQCAQCHDHPFDGWRREQFHQLASYFGKLGERPVVERVNDKPMLVAQALSSRNFNEHKMPDKDDPTKGTVMAPKFLDGHGTPSRSNDAERRKALAEMIASKDNYWFAAAFVNRIWGEMMGQAFRNPIDDMGPGKDVVMPDVLARVAASFAGNRFDIKGLLRSICNSETYQRQLRPGESSDQHLQFASPYPSRLHAEALWQSLVTVLGAMGPPAPAAPRGPGAFRFSLEGQFKNEFEFDPSLPPDEIEGSIPQALMLMNNPQIQRRIQVQGTNLLARILSAYPKDEDALRMVYLRTLSRKPTDREQEKALAYIHKVGKRSEAYEDLLWALLNSTEFQTKR